MKLLANAKINLTLDIKGKTENGYHLIDSVFQSVSLYDEVSLDCSNTLSVCFSDKTIFANESVAYRAALAFFEYTDIKSGAKIAIENHIPTSSGMGGGSSDAAAVLLGLDRLYNTKLSMSELINIASPLGADIPFCLTGGTARVKGIGEIVSPVKFAGDYPVLIIKDGLKQSTGQMYSMLDQKPSLPDKTDFLIDAINNKNTDMFFNNISNAFNSVSDISREKALLENSGALAVGLSGSGPSVFGIFNSAKTRNLAYNALKSEHNCYIADFSKSGIVNV